MADDRRWMEKAVQQARLSRGEAGRIFPRVGAVVVSKNGEWLGEAHRGEDPNHKDHAEYYVIEKKLNSAILANATGVIAPVPGIMRLFWAFSSSNPPESPSQEEILRLQICLIHLRPDAAQMDHP